MLRKQKKNQNVIVLIFRIEKLELNNKDKLKIIQFDYTLTVIFHISMLAKQIDIKFL